MTKLTAGEVAERLGIGTGMVRRYALALEQVLGIHIEIDPVRGRLYPEQVVQLLEEARAYVVQHPGGSVEEALRHVTGQVEPDETPARPPPSGTDHLPALLREFMAQQESQSLALAEQNRELLQRHDQLAAQVQELAQSLQEARQEVSALKTSLEEREAPQRPAEEPQQATGGGLLGILRRLGRRKR